MISGKFTRHDLANDRISTVRTAITDWSGLFPIPMLFVRVSGIRISAQKRPLQIRPGRFSSLS